MIIEGWGTQTIKLCRLTPLKFLFSTSAAPSASPISPLGDPWPAPALHRGIVNHHHSPPPPLTTCSLSRASNSWEKLRPSENIIYPAYTVIYSHISPYLLIAGFGVSTLHSPQGQTCDLDSLKPLTLCFLWNLIPLLVPSIPLPLFSLSLQASSPQPANKLMSCLI